MRGSIRRVARSADPELLVPGSAQQPVPAIPREESVLALRFHGAALGKDVRREEPLGEVVDPEIALAPDDAEDARLGQALEDRPDLVGGAPVPVDRLARAHVARQERTPVADPAEQLLDEWRVRIERPVVVPLARSIPRPPVQGQLRDGNDVEALVVGLVEAPVLVQPVVCPLAAIPGDACKEHEVVVSAGDLQRIELQRADAVDDAKDALRLRRERPRWCEEVTEREEPTRHRRGNVPDLAHVPGTPASSASSRSTNAAWAGWKRCRASSKPNHATRSTSGMRIR